MEEIKKSEVNAAFLSSDEKTTMIKENHNINQIEPIFR
jgi:hypothetical protein